MTINSYLSDIITQPECDGKKAQLEKLKNDDN